MGGMARERAWQTPVPTEEGILMAHVTAPAVGAIPPAEVEDVELYHAHSWWTKYVFCQDAKVIAIQYSVTALAIGLVALVLSWLMRLQLGFPDTFSIIDATEYYQFITMHGMIMVIYLLTALFLGGFGNYLIPLMVGARDMVFPYVNMLSYWIYLLAVLVLVTGFFVPGGPTGAGWTLYPPQAILSGTPGREWGIIMMLLSLILFIIGFTMGGLNYVVTVLQGRTRGMTLMRLPLTVWGIFTATVLALACLPRFVRRLRDDAARPGAGDQLLHAVDRRDGGKARLRRRQPDPVPAPVLVLRPSRGLHRRPAGVRDRVRSDQHPRAQEHLRLSHDGMGDRRHRRPQLRGVGAPHVRQRHGPLFRLLLRHDDADHRRADRDQGLQLGADPVARRHPPHRADAVRPRLHRHLRQRRADRPVPRQRRRRRPALGHDVRRRPLPHGDGRGADHGHLRRHLSLVPQDHRAHAGRHPRQVPLLGHLPRRLPDLLPDPLSRPDGRAAPLLLSWARRRSSRSRPTPSTPSSPSWP